MATCEAFNLKPAQVMMVAAHSDDLKAAAGVGMRTGHVAQVNEFGPNTGEAKPKVPVDVAARSFTEFADMMT